jgi:hypothetical protein
MLPHSLSSTSTRNGRGRDYKRTCSTESVHRPVRQLHSGAPVERAILCRRRRDSDAAARIGPGSTILGFYDERSTDHFWVPLLHLFLREGD